MSVAIHFFSSINEFNKCFFQEKLQRNLLNWKEIALSSIYKDLKSLLLKQVR